jgi:hypothetical protein
MAVLIYMDINNGHMATPICIAISIGDFVRKIMESVATTSIEDGQTPSSTMSKRGGWTAFPFVIGTFYPIISTVLSNNLVDLFNYFSLFFFTKIILFG